MTTSRLSSFVTSDRVAALLAAVCMALAFGGEYGTSNHNSYLVHALHRSDPTILSVDWLVSTPSYHPVFTWLAAGMFATGLGPTGFVVANVLVSAAGGAALAWLCWPLPPGHRGIALFALTGGVIATKSASVGGSYIFSDLFQPSSLGGLGLLVALAAFVNRRWLLSGIAIAVGGLFHANYLVLGVPLFLGAHVLLGRDGLPRRLILQALPGAIALACLAPTILRVASGPEAAVARDLLMNVRAPHHYRTNVRDVAVLFGWQLLGLAAYRRSRSSAPGALDGVGALWAVMGSMLLAAFVGTTVVFVPQVAQAFVWRLAPFAMVLAWHMGVVVLLEGMRVPLIASAGVVLVAGLPKMLTGLLLGVIGSWGARTSFSRLGRVDGLVFTRVVLAGLVVVLTAVCAYRSWRPGASGLPEDLVALHAWARSGTPATAVFLVPPEMETFRLHARRAIVADWKSPPIDGQHMIEWYRRMERLAGVPRPKTLDEVAQGYRSIDPRRLVELRDEFKTDFAVLAADAPHMVELVSSFVVATRIGRYVVLDLREGA